VNRAPRYKRNITVEEFNRLTKPKKRSKHKNNRCESKRGEKFDSEGELNRWEILQLLEQSGKISELRRQVRFHFIINGVNCGAYDADFVYVENGVQVVEDFKSEHTAKLRMFILKKKLMLAVHGIKIKVVIG
jgi:hypothetical protein